MRHGDGGEEERQKVAISVRHMHRGCGCEKRNELVARGDGKGPGDTFLSRLFANHG
jgi:hypothetical protein